MKNVIKIKWLKCVSVIPIIALLSILVVKPLYAGSDALIMDLLKVGRTFAVVKYNGNKITVRKYYPQPNEPLFGNSIDMTLLVPCIGLGVIATVKNGEILALICHKEGISSKPVIVVPDEFIRSK